MSDTNNYDADLTHDLENIFPSLRDTFDSEGQLILFAKSQVLGNLTDGEKNTLLGMILNGKSESHMAEFVLKNPEIQERYNTDTGLRSLKRLLAHHRNMFLKKHYDGIPAHLLSNVSLYSNEPLQILSITDAVIRQILTRMQKYSEMDSMSPFPMPLWREEAKELRQWISTLFHMEMALGHTRRHKVERPAPKREYMAMDDGYERIFEVIGLTNDAQKTFLLNKARHFTPLRGINDGFTH